MSEEEVRVLKMIEEGKVNAEDGYKLLTAINEAAAARKQGESKASAEVRTQTFGWDDDPFWGRNRNNERTQRERDQRQRERDQRQRERDQRQAELDRRRAEHQRIYDQERARAQQERDRMRQERERLREETRRNRDYSRPEGRGGRGFSINIPPIPAIPAIPAMPPLPPMPEMTTRLGVADTSPLSEEAVAGTRFFRVRVSDSETGESKVDLRLPLALVNFGIKVATRYLPEDMSLDLQDVQESMLQGSSGKLLEVTDTENGTKVEIIIEG